MGALSNRFGPQLRLGRHSMQQPKGGSTTRLRSLGRVDGAEYTVRRSDSKCDQGTGDHRRVDNIESRGAMGIRTNRELQWIEVGARGRTRAVGTGVEDSACLWSLKGRRRQPDYQLADSDTHPALHFGK